MDSLIYVPCSENVMFAPMVRIVAGRADDTYTVGLCMEGYAYRTTRLEYEQVADALGAVAQQELQRIANDGTRFMDDEFEMGPIQDLMNRLVGQATGWRFSDLEIVYLHPLLDDDEDEAEAQAGEHIPALLN